MKAMHITIPTVSMHLVGYYIATHSIATSHVYMNKVYYDVLVV